MNKTRNIAQFLLIVSLLLIGSVKAQQTQPQFEATGLALEKYFYPGRPPAYQQVASAGGKASTDIHQLFSRIANWQPAAGSRLVNSVVVTSQLENDAVRVTFSIAYESEAYLGKSQQIASYLLHIDEKVMVEALRQYGIEPFAIRVVRVPPPSTNPPKVVSQSPSVEAVGVEPATGTFAYYNLALKNNSSKAIRVIAVNVKVGGKIRLSSYIQRIELPKIEPGGVYRAKVLLANEAANLVGGHAVTFPENQTIEITTVVYDDGSFEGNPNTASTIRAQIIGEKIQLKQIIGLLRKAFESGEAAEVFFRTIKEKLAATQDLLITDGLNLLSQEFSAVENANIGNLKAIRSEILRQAMNRMSTVLAEAMVKYEKTNEGNNKPDEFRGWLTKTISQFEMMLRNR